MFFSLGQTEEWFISGKMLSASNGLNALFALFFLFSFTEISQGSENQPKNGVDGTYGWNLLFYGINISMEFFRSFFFLIFTSVMRLFTRKKTSQLSVFVSGNWFLSTLVSDTLKLFSEDKSRNKRAGWYGSPSFVWSTSTLTEQGLSWSVLRMIIAVLCGKVSNKS